MNKQYLIEKWAKGFCKLYEKPDLMRSPEEIWIATMAHCSSIGEAIRKYDFVELMDYAARSFCWMLSFSMKCAKTKELLFRCENTFCEMVYLKFPERCGHCTHDVCQCDPSEMDAKKDKAGHYRESLEIWKRNQRGIKYNINDWLTIFTKIYSGRIHLQTMETLGFHFLEEAGEETAAIRKLMQLRGVVCNGVSGLDEKLKELVTIPQITNEYIRLSTGQLDGKPHIDLTSNKPDDIYARIVSAKMDLVVELADTFSFFCSILIKLGNVTIEKGTSFVTNLEEILIKKYGTPDKGLVCPSCRDKACKCVFYSKSAHSQNQRAGI